MIKINNSPIYFKVPTHTELVEKVNALDVNERLAIEGIVYRLAKSEKVPIAGWDKEWGKYHVFDCDHRLINACLQQIKNGVEFHAQCSEKIADLVMQYCPCIDKISLDSQTFQDLIFRAKCLARLDHLRVNLSKKYPTLDLFSTESTPRIRAWKAQETFLLTLPVCVLENEAERFNHLTSVVQELVNGNYDIKTVELILDKLLERESRRPSSSDLENHRRLLEIKKVAESQIYGSGLEKANESVFKDIFVLPNMDNKQAKFKPLHSCEATKEVYASLCDRLLGFGMTPPTRIFKTSDLVGDIDTVRKLFLSAAVSADRTVIVKMDDENNVTRGKDIFVAQRLRQKAFTLFNGKNIPQEVRNSIFTEMFHLCGNGRSTDRLGEFLFLGQNGYEVSDKHRERAIQNYMRSQAFKDHQSKFSQQGSIQLWVKDCDRAFDYIVKDEQGGSKLKTAPKTLVHFSALLGILKGSMDCSSGNNLIQWNPSSSEVIHIWDMDDEKSMPPENKFWHIRLWQMGLPQCAQPFDKAFLLLFSDPALLRKLKQIQVSPNIPDTAYQAQLQRLTTIIELFNSELKKQKITLTPRELFFNLFGGREHYDFVKKGFNEDKSFSSDGIRISPIELFEFQLPEIGRGAWYTGDEHGQWVVGQNMKKLYAPELP